MAIRNIRRQATNPLAASGTPTASPIYVDSDDNKLKMIPASSGTTEVEIMDVATAQTVTGVKTFAGAVFTTPTITVADNVFAIVDDGDATKVFKVQASGITTATTRTWTVPDSSDTFVGKATTDSLSNKSFPTAGFGLTNATSGTITVAAPSGALGTPTVTVPAATDTLVGKATTDTLTNKTLASGTNAINSAIQGDYKVLAAPAAFTTNVVAATLTGFSWTVAAAGTYIFEVNLPATMTTNGGLTVNFKLTTATLTSIQYQSYAATASDNTTAVSTQGTTTTDATKVFDSKTAAYTLVTIRGSMVVNAGGTFAWQACQNTSHSDTTTVLTGAYAKLLRTA